MWLNSIVLREDRKCFILWVDDDRNRSNEKIFLFIKNKFGKGVRMVMETCFLPDLQTDFSELAKYIVW